MAACLPANAQWETDCEPAALRRLATDDYENGVWFSLGQLRRLNDACKSGPSYGYYQMMRAQVESFVGNHATALWHADRPSNQEPGVELSSSATAVPAVEYVAERAQGHRIVMVNERHHSSSDRLLTMDLLAPLAEQGFRYFAVEAAWIGDPVNTRGYPVPQTGYYVNDVVFAELIRSAVELGYRIVAYEIENHQRSSNDPPGETRRQAQRDWWQARNIATRVFDVDGDAKLLVHCGYAHLQESRTDSWAPMAHFLRQMTGLDPLTIDQTVFSERGRPEVEHPLRRRAKELGLLGEQAIVVLDSDGRPVRSPMPVDVGIFGVATRYPDGRPSWMSMGGRRRAIALDTPACVERACIAEARRAGRVDEIPLDRVEIVGADKTTLYVPADTDVVVQFMDLAGTIVATSNVHVSDP